MLNSDKYNSEILSYNDPLNSSERGIYQIVNITYDFGVFECFSDETLKTQKYKYGSTEDRNIAFARLHNEIHWIAQLLFQSCTWCFPISSTTRTQHYMRGTNQNMGESFHSVETTFLWINWFVFTNLHPLFLRLHRWPDCCDSAVSLQWVETILEVSWLQNVTGTLWGKAQFTQLLTQMNHLLTIHYPLLLPLFNS